MWRRPSTASGTRVFSTNYYWWALQSKSQKSLTLSCTGDPSKLILTPASQAPGPSWPVYLKSPAFPLCFIWCTSMTFQLTQTRTSHFLPMYYSSNRHKLRALAHLQSLVDIASARLKKMALLNNLNGYLKWEGLSIFYNSSQVVCYQNSFKNQCSHLLQYYMKKTNF